MSVIVPTKYNWKTDGYLLRSHGFTNDDLSTPETSPSWDGRLSVEWEGGALRILSPEGLIMLKSLRKSGQVKDDIEYLRELIRKD